MPDMRTYVDTLRTEKDREDAWEHAHRLAKVLVDTHNAGQFGVRVVQVQGYFNVELHQQEIK